VTIKSLIEPGDSLVASDVDATFKSFTTDLVGINSEKIEDNSIRTRHIATDRGAWKEITRHKNTANPTQAADVSDVTLVPQTASTETVTETGQMVLIIATFQFAAGSGDTDCTVVIKLDGVLKRTVLVDVATKSKHHISVIYAFQASANSHLIQLIAKGGGANYTLSGYELQVVAVRG
jgi:hypothetical protein